MANPIAQALSRLRGENESLRKIVQEQESTILELRSSLSVQKSIESSLRKRVAACVVKNNAPKTSNDRDDGPFRTTVPKKYKAKSKAKPLRMVDASKMKKCNCGVYLPPENTSGKCLSCENTFRELSGGGFQGGSGSRIVRSTRGLS